MEKISNYIVRVVDDFASNINVPLYLTSTAYQGNTNVVFKTGISGVSYPTVTTDLLYRHTTPQTNPPIFKYYRDGFYQKTYTPAIDKDFDAYPVSNIFVDNTDTLVFEIAVVGFSKEDIKISRKNDILTITGELPKRDQTYDEIYFHRKLATRNFDLNYRIHDNFDISKLESNLDLGKLTIKIPLKSECVPTTEEFKIK